VHRPAFEYLADVAQRLGHYGAARDALVHLDALEGSTVPAMTRAQRARRIGNLALRAGDAPIAATYLQQAVSAGVDDTATLGALARARLAIGDVTGAAEAIDRGLLSAPRDAELLRLSRAIKATADRAGREGHRPRS
jgi:hypothetical protein